MLFDYFCGPSLDGIYSGMDDELHPHCEQCPRSNETLSNTWCGGNCIYDEKNQMCKEGNFYVSQKWG